MNAYRNLMGNFLQSDHLEDMKDHRIKSRRMAGENGSGSCRWVGSDITSTETLGYSTIELIIIIIVIVTEHEDITVL
jgi:hypothetical protein